MSGPHFEQLRTRLKGLGLGRVGMKKLKNSHKGRVVRKFRTREGGCVSFAHLKGVCEIFAQGKMVCEIFAYPWFSKTESMVLKFCHKNEFAQGSHSCEIRTEILGRDREHVFFKIGTKANSDKGCVVRKFRTTGSVVRKLPSLGFSPLFSLVFTMTSFFKLSYLHVNTKTNLNHIRMNLRAKIKIKTCINTRKTLN